MNFSLTEEHLMIRKAARDFANSVCKPGVIERDSDQIWPEKKKKAADEIRDACIRETQM